MSIYFLRHIQTLNNKNGILSGRLDSHILPDAQITLPDKCPFFDIVHSSTARRCVDTVSLIPIKYLTKQVYFTDMLLERHLGILEGLSKSYAIEIFPMMFTNNRIDVTTPIPEGESIEAVQERLQPEVTILLSLTHTDNCLVCSHNQTLKILYAMIYDIEITNSYWCSTNFENGVITKII